MSALAPAPAVQDALAVLASADERVLWATLAAAATLGLWGAIVGWRGRPTRDQTRDQTGD